jgi:polyphenol oxidase
MKVKNNLIQFLALSQIDFIKHGFSTRQGGVSKGHLSSMNLSFSRGDKKENVYENYKRICLALDLAPTNLVFSDQIHDTKIHRATAKDMAGVELDKKKLIGIDGLITNEPELVLTTSYADCVPLFFVDTQKKAIGLAHSGWRGTVGKIGKKTVETMTSAFGSDPNNIISVIGPSICKKCYEVSQDVVVEFKKSLSETICEQIIENNKMGKFQLDLWLANQYILMEAGIPKENITISGICTCCHSDLLFSHRASNGLRGNLGAFLSIK